MKKSLLLLGLSVGLCLSAQKRYLDEAFSVTVTNDVEYGVNIDFLTSRFSNASRVQADITEIKTALAMSNPIPAKYYNPADTSTFLKVKSLKMDIYRPANDTMTDRPVIMYIHTGNFLPPPLNGSPNGTKTDSAAVNLCRQWAARGFVAVAFNYRHGWNPIAATAVERRATLLNAVYRALHDSKQAVRHVKANASAYGASKNKIVLYGQGSGGYVALAYATLDKFAEVEIPKFINPVTSNSYVDTNTVGNLEGFGGVLNLYAPNGESSDIHMTVNAGGALADTSWLEAGDVPMVSFHCLRDPFAPFDEGTVIVPTTNEDVVDVQGPNVFLQKANALGNNSSFANFNFNDSYTAEARTKYNGTYSYIFPAPNDQMTVNANEGMYVFLRAKGATLFENQGSPWEWWNPNSAIAQSVVNPGPPPITAHQASLISNPDMSRTKGLTYLDTIQGYMIPRVMVALQLDGYIALGSDENAIAKNYSLYPNPTNGRLVIKVDAGHELEEVSVYDMSGRMVANSARAFEGKIELDLSELPQGLYLVKTSVDGQIHSTKVTKY